MKTHFTPHDFSEMTLPESRIYTCVDESRSYALHFLEGQKLVQDMALMHQLYGSGFAFFRKICLTFQPMLCLLKQGEYFGFYLDSDEPYFRLKIELSAGGAIRAMLLPEDFQEFPEKVSGTMRLNKYSAKIKSPYQSVLEIQNHSLDKISDHILQNSYQMVGSVIVSETSDQSILVLKLPNPESSEEVDEMEGSMELPPHQVNLYHQMLSKGETDSEKIQLLLKENGFDFLAGRDVFFRCNCSHKRMIQNLHLYQQNDPQPLFDESQTSLSVTCEYCKKEYQITAEDLNQNPYVVN